KVNQVLLAHGINTTVIDSKEISDKEKLENYIVGRTTAKTLIEAGIEEAVGILAGTDDDGYNLGILLNARYLKPNLFTLVRQNRHENKIAFEVSNIDMVMQPTLVTARRILFLLIAPLLKSFFYYLLQEDSSRKMKMEEVIKLLERKVGDKTPHLVTVNITPDRSRAVMKFLEEGKQVLLGELIRDPDNVTRELDLVFFVVKSGDEIIVLPNRTYKIKAGDQILFCGTALARRLFNATLNNEYKLYYVQNGIPMPRGYFMQWWYMRKSKNRT
ncbi:MAG: NAD-binding protein, partial [Gammaproteobacteria bacterium]